MHAGGAAWSKEPDGALLREATALRQGLQAPRRLGPEILRFACLQRTRFGKNRLVEFPTFINMIDAAVRAECPSANLQLKDRSVARWSCDDYSVDIQLFGDAYRMTIDQTGTVIYQAMDFRDETSALQTASLIARALQGEAA